MAGTNSSLVRAYDLFGWLVGWWNVFTSLCASIVSPNGWVLESFFYTRRLALHKYDPPDLQASLASVAPSAVTNGSDEEESPTRAVPPTSEWSIRDQELADAKKKGLLVDMGTSTTTKTSPTSVVFMEEEAVLVVPDEMKELDLWETSGTHVDEFDWDDGDDSDDELL